MKTKMHILKTTAKDTNYPIDLTKTQVDALTWGFEERAVNSELNMLSKD